MWRRIWPSCIEWSPRARLRTEARKIAPTPLPSSPLLLGRNRREAWWSAGWLECSVRPNRPAVVGALPVPMAKQVQRIRTPQSERAGRCEVRSHSRIGRGVAHSPRRWCMAPGFAT